MNAHYTPIGPVSIGFSHFAELMERAHIGYEDEMAEDELVRRWFIISDTDRVPATKRKTTGRSYKDEKDMRNAANEHRKFCMIRDAILHLCKFPMEADELLLAVLQKIREIKRKDGTIVQVGSRVDELWALPWQQCETAVANMGVAGYQDRKDNLPDV